MTYRNALFVGGPLDGEVRQVADVPVYSAPQLDVRAALWVPDDAPPPSTEEVRMHVVTYRRSTVAKGDYMLRLPVYILESLTTADEINAAIRQAVGKAHLTGEHYYWKPEGLRGR